MASKPKRNIVLKKKSTKDQEKSVTTIPQNEKKNIQTAESKNVQAKVEEQAQKVIGDVGGSVIAKPQWRIKFEAQVAPFPMFLLPEHIRKYLVRNGFTSELYKKDKEWLEKHNVDMDIVNDLKKFLTERL